jgi:hypothetical protein
MNRIRSVLLLIALALVVFCGQASPTWARSLVFHDGFNDLAAGQMPSSQRWVLFDRCTTNKAATCARATPKFLHGDGAGHLFLSAYRTGYANCGLLPNNPPCWHAGALRSVYSTRAPFQYRIAAKVTNPAVMGEWNALGGLYRADFQSGEIDTQEWLGKYPSVLNGFAKSNGIRAAAHNVNFVDSPPSCHQPVANFSRAYHVYGVNVFLDRMEWTIDGCVWGSTQKSTVDSTTWANLTQKDYFTKIALLIGGNKFWAGSWSDVPNGITMKVDWVRFYK